MAEILNTEDLLEIVYYTKGFPNGSTSASPIARVIAG
jgi:hypothetical protein